MPVIRLYRHGLTAGTPPGKRAGRGRKSQLQGWTNSSTRSNTRFLYSVEEGQLTGHGYALSLTMRDCPPDSDTFHRVRRAYVERLRRMGLKRMHWLIEWQRRGVPHLHAAVWLPKGGMRFHLVDQWCEVAAAYGAEPYGQHVKAIHDSVGWFKYLSKHASRGVAHYQRSAQSIPAGWEKTGRMWGRLGEWPVREAMGIELDRAATFRFRRMVRGWRCADARRAMSRAQQGTPGVVYPSEYWAAVRRLGKARGMLKCGVRELSEVRGVSEWIPLDESLRMIACLVRDGATVKQI